MATKYVRLIVEKEWAKKIKAIAKKRGESAYRYLKAVEEAVTKLK